MSWCDNPRDHEREGAEDYRRRGRYGYARERYEDRYEDDCAAAYMRGFRSEERRAERRREEEAQLEIEQQQREREIAQAAADEQAADEQAAYEYWEQCQQQDYEQHDDQQL